MVTKESTINQLKYAIQALALEASDQLTLFPDFAVVTDELLMDFDNWKNAAIGNYPDYFSSEQLKILDDIDAFIAKFELEDPEMPVIDELKISSFWRELRVIARNALVQFNWPNELPPYNQETFVKA